MPSRPFVSRKPTRSSPNMRVRMGAPSGSATSSDMQAGSQWRRMIWPIGRSPSTRVRRSLSSRVTMALRIAHWRTVSSEVGFGICYCEAKRCREVKEMRLLPAILMVLAGTVGPLHAQPFQLMDATIDDVRAALAAKRISCRALVEQYLGRIDAYDKRGPALNAVQTINRRAVEEAARLDAAPGPVGPLHCVPILMKDQVETSDMPTTYGSAVFKDFVPMRDATIVTKLKKAGAVIVAKTDR